MPSVVSHSSVPASNSTLSKRRRFQPPITSYFNSTPSDPSSVGTSASHNHYSAATSSPTPVLPAKVQSSLLSVGMRVRKSIADGYKTQLAMKSEKVMPPTSVAEAPATAQSYTRGGCFAELAPFSGVSKFSYDSADNSGHLITDDGDAYSLPPSSQESNTSSASFPSAINGQKRALESDIFVDDDAWEDDAGSQLRQETPVGRHILSPSLGQQRRRMLGLTGTMDQSTMDLDDFEEASFLRRREEVDADYVRMDCV